VLNLGSRKAIAYPKAAPLARSRLSLTEEFDQFTLSEQRESKSTFTIGEMKLDQFSQELERQGEVYHDNSPAASAARLGPYP